MKVDFSKVLLDLDGAPLKVKDREGAEARTMVLKDAALVALCANLEADRGMSGRQVFERLELARRINKGGEVEIEPAQAALIQERLPQVYPTLIAGAAYELLQG